MKEGSGIAVCSDVQDFQACNMPLPRLQTPAAGEVHLWFLDLSVLVGSLQDALGGDRKRPAVVDAHQLLFARRFYLRLLLGAYLGLPGKSVRINRKQRGKPVLDASFHDSELHFSMAKSESRLLIGLSTSSHIGVDLEPIDRKAQDSLGVAQRYFSRTEAESLSALPPEEIDAAFLRAWACKEAVVKASGMGIANQFCRFTVETNPCLPAAILEFDDQPASDWMLALARPDPGFLGAVAVHESVGLVRAFRLLPARQPSG